MQADPISTSLTAILMWNGATQTDGPRLQDLWANTKDSDSQGFLGLVQIFADAAHLSQTIWEEMQTLGVFDCPGVFDYEVSEEFGTWFHRALGDCDFGETPTVEAQNLAFGEIIWQFFEQVPGSLSPEQQAVITKHTAYTPFKETTFTTPAPAPSPHVVICQPNVFGPFDSDALAHEYAAQHLNEEDDYTVKPIIPPNKA